MNKNKTKTTKTPFENNWMSKSLEALEKDYWSEPENSSHLIITCHKLRKKQLKEFQIEDLRIMIGQNIGLNYLIPIAFTKLKNNILAEGDFYEGDLLKSVLTRDSEFWQNEPTLFAELETIISQNEKLLSEEAPEFIEIFNQLTKK